MNKQLILFTSIMRYSELRHRVVTHVVINVSQKPAVRIFRFLTSRREKHVPPKCWYPYTRLDHVITQKTTNQYTTQMIRAITTKITVY
jgi:hypothetical protein